MMQFLFYPERWSWLIMFVLRDWNESTNQMAAHEFEDICCLFRWYRLHVALTVRIDAAIRVHQPCWTAVSSPVIARWKLQLMPQLFFCRGWQTNGWTSMTLSYFGGPGDFKVFPYPKHGMNTVVTYAHFLLHLLWGHQANFSKRFIILQSFFSLFQFETWNHATFYLPTMTIVFCVPSGNRTCLAGKYHKCMGLSGKLSN